MTVGPFGDETIGGFTDPPALDGCDDFWPGKPGPEPCERCGRVHRLRPSGWYIGQGFRCGLGRRPPTLGNQ